MSYLTRDIDSTQQFYIPPKIHKNFENTSGRSIVSGSGEISQFVYHFNDPLILLFKVIIRDSTHLVNIFNNCMDFLMCPYAQPRYHQSVHKYIPQ